ncbi:hypothetical protein [Tessaracoccus sp. ZS01]|uniref:hypothetical protein n=1 Tax=Tessaracoccus sp. ZS01 TaxID=1906324 RepID=UPI00117CAD82|nr:hypothetical protein [Tessaracoccus sp. ZS01]
MGKKLSVKAANALMIGAVLLLGLSACGGSTPENDYPAEVRTNFLDACVAQPGATSSMCSKCLEAVEDEFSLGEFVELEAGLTAGTASRADSDKFAKVLLDCAS